MAWLVALLLLAPDPPAEKVPRVIELLKKSETKEALHLLKEIGTLKKNHSEAKALVQMIRTTKVKKSPEVVEAGFLALKGIGSRKVTRSVLALLKKRQLQQGNAMRRALRVGVCRALEGSADPAPAAVDAVIDLMRDRDDHVIAGAAQAAGAYRHAKESIRKELFKTIVGIYESTWNLKNAVNPDLKVQKRRAEQKWEVVEKPMEKALQLLSNVTQNSPPKWRRWWNKNKKKRWEDLEG